MKLSQKRAIYYAYYEKKIERYQKIITQNELEDDFRNEFDKWIETHCRRYGNMFYSIYLRKKGLL